MKKNISLMLLILALVGCQSKERFSEAQIAAMKRAGSLKIGKAGD